MSNCFPIPDCCQKPSHVRPIRGKKKRKQYNRKQRQIIYSCKFYPTWSKPTVLDGTDGNQDEETREKGQFQSWAGENFFFFWKGRGGRGKGEELRGVSFSMDSKRPRGTDSFPKLSVHGLFSFVGGKAAQAKKHGTSSSVAQRAGPRQHNVPLMRSAGACIAPAAVNRGADEVRAGVGASGVDVVVSRKVAHFCVCLSLSLFLVRVSVTKRQVGDCDRLKIHKTRKWKIMCWWYRCQLL